LQTEHKNVDPSVNPSSPKLSLLSITRSLSLFDFCILCYLIVYFIFSQLNGTGKNEVDYQIAMICSAEDNGEVKTGNFMMERTWDDYVECMKPVTLHIPDKGRVLDSGCGIGRACRDLSNMYPNLDVIGVNFTPFVSVTPVYPSLMHNLENSLPFENVDMVIDIYGAISYSCYPIKVLNNIFKMIKDEGYIYIFSTFLGRLEGIFDIVDKVEGIGIDFWDGDRRLVLIKEHDFTGIDESLMAAQFYSASFSSHHFATNMTRSGE